AHLWSKTFEGTVSGIFALEDQIASSIVRTLKGSLLPASAPALVKAPTASTEAHDLFLQGRHFAARRSAEGLRTAADLYARAVEIDPRYALGWVGIAEVNALRHQYDPNPTRDMLTLARESAQKALQLQPALAEAHALLGLVDTYSWRWADAERALRRA